MVMKIKDQVRHPGFGIGEVADIFQDPENEAEMMLVKFPNPPGRAAGSTGLFPTGVYPVGALPVVGGAG